MIRMPNLNHPIHLAMGRVVVMTIGFMVTCFTACQKSSHSASTSASDDAPSTVASSGGSSSTTKSSATSSSTSTGTAKAKNADSSVVTSNTKDLALAGSLSILPPKASSGSSFRLAAKSDYESDETSLSVRDDAFVALDQAGAIYCIVNQLGYIDQVNTGKYIAQVDRQKCFGDKGSDSASTGASGSDSQAGAVNYLPVIVDSVREAGKPLTINFWLVDLDQQGTLYGKVVIVEGATAKNPFGVFRINWAQASGGGGGLDVFSDQNGSINLRMLDTADGVDNNHSLAFSAILNRDATTDEITGGLMTTKSDETIQGQAQSSAFKVAFNNDRMLRKNAAGVDKCFDRNLFDTLAWDYNLYDASTGKRIALNSGYPIEYSLDGKVLHGYVGYYGLWVEGSKVIPDGATVSRISDWKTQTKADYTIKKSNGKLTKNTRVELKLANIIGIDLGIWDLNLNKQIRVIFNGKNFQSTGEFKQTAQGGSWEDSTVADYTLHNGSNNFWSEGLGPVEVLVEDGTVTKITITKTEDVTSKAGDLTLTCLFDCPVAAITQNMVNETSNASPFSPKRDWGTLPTLAGAATLKFVQAELSLKRDDTKVAFADGLDLSSSNKFRSGLRSGPMLAASDATSLAAFYNATVYYTWEMGTEPWTFFTGVKDSDGNFVSFDPPTQFTYTHAAANDVDGRGISFYGKKFRLNYGGPGQLWGIPTEKASQGGNAPLFSLNSGTLLGPNNMYVVKIIQGEQRMKEATACSGLTLTDVPALPKKDDLKPITMVNAPSSDDLLIEVIDGEILSNE